MIKDYMNRDYREKDVKGIITDAKSMRFTPCEVTVRMTSDRLGQSLSLSAFNIMIEIPLEPVRDIIRVTEKGGNRDR